MPMQFKCTVCQETASLPGRQAAIEGGWTFVEVVSRARTKYWAICPRHTALGWLKSALGEDRK